MPDVIPYAMIKPHVEVSEGATTVVMECLSTGFDFSPEQDESSIETFCGTYTNYKAEKWKLIATVVQSFGTDGLWTTMRPLVGKTVDYTVLPDADAVVSVDNPEATGQARVKCFTFIKGKPGEPDEFDLELACQGTPVFSIVPGATRTADADAVAELEPEPA